MAPPEQGPLYEVTGQTEDFGANSSGQYVQGTRVSFRTRSGATSSVFVPGNEFSVQRVQEAISGQAQAMEQVAHLRG
jgi:hypothetical protein